MLFFSIFSSSLFDTLPRSIKLTSVHAGDDFGIAGRRIKFMDEHGLIWQGEGEIKIWFESIELETWTWQTKPPIFSVGDEEEEADRRSRRRRRRKTGRKNQILSTALMTLSFLVSSIFLFFI